MASEFYHDNDRYVCKTHQFFPGTGKIKTRVEIGHH